jgi:hypothetical protein
MASRTGCWRRRLELTRREGHLWLAEERFGDAELYMPMRRWRRQWTRACIAVAGAAEEGKRAYWALLAVAEIGSLSEKPWWKGIWSASGQPSRIDLPLAVLFTAMGVGQFTIPRSQKSTRVTPDTARKNVAADLSARHSAA